MSGASKILVVDDEPNIRLTTRMALETSGMLVDEVEDGKAALERLLNVPVDLILLDLWMPQLDGLETLRQLRQRGDKTPVVIITAHGCIPDTVAAMRLGAIDFLQKPMTPEALRTVVAEVLQRHSPVKAEPIVAAAEPETDASRFAEKMMLRETGAEPPGVRRGGVLSGPGAGPRASFHRSRAAARRSEREPAGSRGSVPHDARTLPRRTDAPPGTMNRRASALETLGPWIVTETSQGRWPTMEYRLTFHGLVIGSLAVGLTILATAWVLQGLARIQERWGRRTDRSDAPFDDDGGYWRTVNINPPSRCTGAWRSRNLDLRGVNSASIADERKGERQADKRRDATFLTPARTLSHVSSPEQHSARPAGRLRAEHPAGFADSSGSTGRSRRALWSTDEAARTLDRRRSRAYRDATGAL